MLCTVPRLMLAAPHGRSGKTAVTMAVLAALRQRGFTVQAFKKGPDYIDPGWLTMASGRPCRTLDSFWMTPAQLRAAFCQATRDCDLAVIEGAMGLYDGVDVNGTGSSAAIAKILRTPVILIVDTTRMTRSAAAVVLGFQQFDPVVNIAGVILNKVARPRHEALLRAAIAKYCHVPVLGAVPKDALSVIPERHLGLVTAAEQEDCLAVLDKNAQTAVNYLDLTSIAALARQAPALAHTLLPPVSPGTALVKVGIIRDEAFSFYYPENLEALTAAGARLIFFNSFSDRLPDCDGLYIGGGFPEVFAARLAANASLRQAIKDAAARGVPIYAECGGLMYLARTLTWQERVYPMCGVLPGDAVMAEHPQGHGYTVLQVERENPFFPVGSVLKGHEFHHSHLVNLPADVKYCFRVQRGCGITGRADGLLFHNVLATYNHIHAAAYPAWAKNFVAAARTYRDKN